MRADDVLPDSIESAEFSGMTVRKGTIAAFLQNARVWTDAAAKETERAEAERDIQEALPALQALGLFEVLAVRDPKLAAFIAAWSA